MAKKQRIRAIALCLLHQGDQILVQEGYDSITHQRFARPLGGGIDFGETSQQAVVREIQEELGADITAVKLLVTVESIFDYEGKPGHEIVFVYEAEFVDRSLYQQEVLTAVEGARRFQAHWRSLEELARLGVTLVPGAIANLL
ncbi:MAG: NUDIX hydrolase [Cyanobacteria bacterium REEB459]|nr:NUDIX hydrolase [Cyanobacteria bacterium REEB459]